MAVVLAFSAYIAVVVTGVVVHEPWWDEAQAWLLARDVSIIDLLTVRLAYEGHPPLWYLLLALPARLHLPYKSINVVSAAIATAGVFMLLRQKRVPLALRLALPFTFYVAYQYTVVSRSYVLIPPLLVAILSIYKERDRRLIGFTLLLIALSFVSLHGLSLACAFLLLFVIDLGRGRLRMSSIPLGRMVVAAFLFALNLVGLVVVLWPPADLSTAGIIDLSFRLPKMASIAWYALTENLIGHALGQAFEPLQVVVGSVMIVILLLWLYSRAVLTEFAVLVASLLPISSIYFSRWHEGIFFWVMMFAILLAFATGVETGRRRAIDVAACIVLAIALFVNGRWTYESLRFDMRSNFTGSRDAADYIRAHGIDRARLFGAGVRCIELQPYFDHNIFVNYDSGRAEAYWDWSTANDWPFPAPAPDLARMRTWLGAQLAANPDYFLTASGFRADALNGQALRHRPDYRLIAQFGGGLFWKDRIIEPIGFELYEHVRAVKPPA